MCIESPDAVSALAMGQVIANKECEHQFKGKRFNMSNYHDLLIGFISAGHRWNCSQVWTQGSIGHIMVVGEWQ